MARKKIRVGLIGCGGNMRNAHVPRLQKAGNVELVAVSDPVEAQSAMLMEKWGGAAVPCYPDYKEMLRREAMDAVVISTPHSMHYEQASLALRKGLHVQMEKPLTTSSRDSKALMRLAERNNLILVVSYQRHFMRPHTYVRELVQKGVLGELRGVVGYVTQNWGRISGWRLDPELSGGGMFMDTGSHLVGATLWMTGLELSEVNAFMDNADKKVDINTVLNLRFKSGALGTLNFFGNAGRHDERIAIHGDKGCVVLHLHQWGVQSLLPNDEPVEIPARIKESSPDEAFVRWIRNGGKGYELPMYAVQVAKLTEAAYKSRAAKKPVKVAR